MKPVGAEVGLTYRTDPDVDITPDHFVVTETGRTYRVTAARNTRPGRWVLRCVVVRPPAPDDAVVHPLRWDRRTRRKP